MIYHQSAIAVQFSYQPVQHNSQALKVGRTVTDAMLQQNPCELMMKALRCKHV